MAQLGAKVSVTTRINTLKGWARSLNMDLPLVPKPVVAAKPRTKRKFKN